ncbi:MAG: hypothetical protein KZQ76_09545 [Candidatus Thiodiazotropha sp. (ex Epidulcina cf. delphinae)]|nr:hypothetical protein [Candidatus Thiodiazotropha sp. (ex Epidulcina cf. delphinae)]
MSAELGIDEERGRMKVSFMLQLQRDLGLVYTPEHWDEVKLATWFCRNLHDPILTHESKRALVPISSLKDGISSIINSLGC